MTEDTLTAPSDDTIAPNAVEVTTNPDTGGIAALYIDLSASDILPKMQDLSSDLLLVDNIQTVFVTFGDCPPEERRWFSYSQAIVDCFADTEVGTLKIELASENHLSA